MRRSCCCIGTGRGYHEAGKLPSKEFVAFLVFWLQLEGGGLHWSCQEGTSVRWGWSSRKP